MSGKDEKIVVIGLDGAPFDVISKWSENGILPHLKEVIEKSTFGCLRSSFLPTSPIAWTSIVSGKNSGKHNIFDWGYREKGTYKIRAVNSTNIKTTFLWDILNKKKKTTGIFNVPITYPPIPVNGFLVSGFDTPNTNVCFTYPEDLTPRIKGHVKDYALSYQESYTPGKERLFIDDLKSVIKAKKEAIFYLLDHFDLDFYLFVLMELDHLHHKMWRFVNDQAKADYIYEVYRLMDETVGEIMGRFPDNTTFFIISDHGAGPLEGIMYINKWLYQLGLLGIKENPSIFLKTLLEKTEFFSKTYAACSNLGLGKILRSLPKSIQENAATSFISFEDIDWKKTKAYSFGRFGQIYINQKGREPQGIVETKKECEDLVEHIISELSRIQDPDNGGKAITKVYRKDQVYSGPYLEDAPDILFEIKGLKYNSSVKFGLKKDSIFDSPEFFDSGTHRREGIFIAQGKNIKTGSSVNEATILEIAPTLLYLMGMEIPIEMDGRILEEIFTEEFRKNNIPCYTKEVAFSQPASSAGYSDTEEQEVKKRLKSLGYLE